MSKILWEGLIMKFYCVFPLLFKTWKLLVDRNIGWGKCDCLILMTMHNEIEEKNPYEFCSSVHVCIASNEGIIDVLRATFMQFIRKENTGHGL